MANAYLCPEFEYNKLPIPAAPLSGEIITTAKKTFRDAAVSYVENSEEKKRRTRQRQVQHLMPHLGHMLLDDLNPFDIEQMAIRLYPTQKNSTRNRQFLMPVRAVIYHAVKRRWSLHYKIASFREDPPVRKKPASPEWLFVFFRQCDEDGLPHIAALILFMSQTGARVSEALRLRWPDLDFIKRTALLRKTKTETNSLRYLTDQIIARLTRLKETAGDDPRVFRMTCRHSVNERIFAVCERARIEYKPSHTCGRHAMASNAMALGADYKTIMMAGGWRSITIFFNVYVNPRNPGRRVSELFNTHHYDAEI